MQIIKCEFEFSAKFTKIGTSLICILTNLGQNEWMTHPVMLLSLSPVIMGMSTTNHRGTHINKHVQRFSIFMWPLKIFFPSSKLMRSNLDMWTISTVQTFLQNRPFFYITCLRNITTTQHDHWPMSNTRRKQYFHNSKKCRNHLVNQTSIKKSFRFLLLSYL